MKVAIRTLYMDSLPDFVKLAEAYGHVGIQITDPAKLDEQLVYALSPKIDYLFIDVLVDKMSMFIQCN